MSFNRGGLMKVAEEHDFKIEAIEGVSGIVVGYKVYKVFRTASDAGEYIKRVSGDADGYDSMGELKTEMVGASRRIAKLVRALEAIHNCSGTMSRMKINDIACRALGRRHVTEGDD